MTIPNDQDTATYYNGRPKKRTGAGILVFNTKDQLLIVKPNYLDRWLCPGGGVEEAESPLSAARRECEEEIGVRFGELWPAYVDYRAPQPNGQSDMIQVLFTTAAVGDDFLDNLHLQKGEIDDARFVDIPKLSSYFSPIRARTVTTYFNNRNGRNVIYMENGELIA